MHDVMAGSGSSSAPKASTPTVYVVVHRPTVQTRISPSLTADVTGTLPAGQAVRGIAKDGWLRLDAASSSLVGGTPGLTWTLIDGGKLGLGPLLVPEGAELAVSAAAESAAGAVTDSSMISRSVNVRSCCDASEMATHVRWDKTSSESTSFADTKWSGGERTCASIKQQIKVLFMDGSLSHLTQKKAAAMQTELLAACSAVQFRRRLYEASQAVGRDKQAQVIERLGVLHEVFAPIIAKYGFVPSVACAIASYLYMNDLLAVDIAFKNKSFCLKWLTNPDSQMVHPLSFVNPQRLYRSVCLELQDELLSQFRRQTFQRSLWDAWAIVGDDMTVDCEQKRKLARRELCLEVQRRVITMFGFEPSQRGVFASHAVFTPEVNANADVAIRSAWLAWLTNPAEQQALPLGPDSPPHSDAALINEPPGDDMLSRVPGLGGIAIRIISSLSNELVCMLEDVSRYNNVRDLKRMIFASVGVPESDQQLLLGSRLLFNADRIGSVEACFMLDAGVVCDDANFSYPLCVRLIRMSSDTGQLVEAIESGSIELKDLPADLRGDRQVVLAAVRASALAFELASDELKRDLDFAIAAMDENARSFEFLGEGLRGNRNVALAAVGRHGAALEFAAEPLKADFEVALLAVKQDPEAIVFVAGMLKDDKGFMRAVRTQC